MLTHTGVEAFSRPLESTSQRPYNTSMLRVLDITSAPIRNGKKPGRLLLSGAILLLALGSNLPAQVRQQTDLGTTGWSLWLDRNASWKNDTLYLPPANISTLSVNPPTVGWNQLFSNVQPESQAATVYANSALSLQAEVPGTVEEFFWDAKSGSNNGSGTSGDYIGVSWWGKSFTVPSTAAGQRVKLVFTEGIRQRAEVFVNQQLVGYELVGQTPFEVDVTNVVQYGATNKLAVRITDATGNFSWGDFDGTVWGTLGTTSSPSGYYFPLSHGFGGILGSVQLKIENPVHVADVFVKNEPTLTDVAPDIQITNEGAQTFSGTFSASIVEAWQHNAAVANPQTVYTAPDTAFQVQAGQTGTVSLTASVPAALLWNIRDANLYNFVVTLKDGQGNVIDQYTQRFGFRFMSVVGFGTNTRLYLNGKRTFLLSAISWGFWPTNGIFPTVALAQKHVASALALGQNMLNFHRCEGNTLVLNAADEMGLLYYEEPGGYSSSRFKTADPLLTELANTTLAAQLNGQKFLRMVVRDRNHPSLVTYNMVNEPGWDPDAQAISDMAAAHVLDPTRRITYGSGFLSPGGSQPSKLNMLPYDQTQRTTGYCDIHNSGGNGSYVDTSYTSPTLFDRNNLDPTEVFVWGEELATATPPQLEAIQTNIAQAGRTGWDGSDYKDWYNAYINYISSKGLAQYYPSLTNLITSMGNVMYYEHGRIIENTRIADDADIYVINGYEDMKLDNMSGVVDIFRNIKGDPTLISQYMQPLYVAVKARHKTGQVGDTNLFDLYVINQQIISAGNYVIKARVQRPDGTIQSLYTGNVTVSGGDKFSDLAAQAVPITLNAGKGYYNITAELDDNGGNKLATGHDEILAVDWNSDAIGGKGAIIGGSTNLVHFIEDVKSVNVVPYSDSLGKLDYVVVGLTNQGTAFNTVSSYNCRALDGTTLGLNLDYYQGKNFNTLVNSVVSTAAIDFDENTKLIPGYDLLGSTNFSLRWQGFIVPDYTGTTQFQVTQDDGVRVWFNGVQVVNAWTDGAARTETFSVNVVAGQPYSIKIEAYQNGGGWQLALKWLVPAPTITTNMSALLTRVQQDGTKLLLIEDTESWVNQLKTLGALPTFSIFHPATAPWTEGSFFVRSHPFFQDLPVNGAMNWEYQNLVSYTATDNFGLYNMTGESPVVSLVGGVSHLVSTAVGTIPYGNGQILFSSLDLGPNLGLNNPEANVPKKILCNYLKWAGGTVVTGLPGVPTGVTGTAGNGQVALNWTAVSGATSYNVKRSTVSGGPYTTVTNLTGTSYVDNAVTNSTTYYYVVSALNTFGEGGNSSPQVAATPSATALPAPWQTADIGTVQVVGSASYNYTNSTFTVVGSGSDIWNAADSFRYVYMPVSGDCTITARVLTVQNTDAWAKAGVMMRETLAAGSTTAMVLVTPGNGVSFESRTITGVSATQSSTGGLVAPYWVRLVRSGNVFTGYRSPNGTTWTSTGSVTIAMALNAYLGLPVTGHSSSVSCTATYDNVSVSMTVAAPTSLTATALSESQMQLNWTNNAINATAYTVQRSLHGANSWTTLTSTLPPGSVTFTDSNLTASTNYDFRVQCTSWGSSSSFATVTAATPNGVGDGIPGWWRLLYFGNGLTTTSASALNADPDGDGTTNQQEYLAGTNPLDPFSVFRINGAAISGNNMVVTFNSVIGITYIVEKTTNLGSGASWSTVMDNITGTGSGISVTDAGAAALSRCFYRVRIK